MRTIQLFSLLFICQVVCFSQQWCAPGSLWNYKLDEFHRGGGSNGYYELKVTGTDILNGKACHVISGYFKGTSYIANDPSGATTTVYVNHKYFTYQQSGVIYISRGGKFDTLVNFNALPGDKWLGTFTDSTCMDYFGAKVVTDTGHIVINGFYLKTITADGGFFIEGIGGASGFLFDRALCGSEDSGDGYFTCYRNDTFLEYMAPWAKECANMVSLEESSLPPALKVFPNPNQGAFNVELANPATVNILDITGKQVFSTYLSSGSNVLHLEQLSDGFYNLEMQQGLSRQTFKLIKVH